MTFTLRIDSRLNSLQRFACCSVRLFEAPVRLDAWNSLAPTKPDYDDVMCPLL